MNDSFMLIDTHAHLNFNAFRNDADKVIRRCLDNETRVINVGSNYETSKKAVELAQNYKEGVFAAVGLHPINLDTGLVKIRTDPAESGYFEKEFVEESYKKLVKLPKVVAVGEIGLDYYYKPKTKAKLLQFKEKQKNLFLKQIQLAEKLSFPIIFHCRMAHRDLTEILSSEIKNRRSEIRGVMHGFVGTQEELEEYLKMGFYIGFNGIIFKSIEGIDFKENIKRTPLKRILIETDCPYLAPPAARTQRNEPIYVRYIAEEIARIKNLSYEEVVLATFQNAKNLFKI